ncbi:DNA-protecting protein DprA [Candidatus Saccharibacteria bacterium]|nr:DNA-protecting protein DprA [Candidatus Saccharibacteria bacterium]
MSTLFSLIFTKINQISPQEHDFTEVLSTIALTPKTLYFRGKLPENVSKNGHKIRPKTVAIVGSRHNTRYGQEVAHNLAYKLAQKGVIVVSGLAYGIDSIGHQGCLDAGGITVAVLGNPIDRIHPSSHTPLAKEIIKNGGAIISEYPPSTSDSTYFAPGEYLSDTGRRQVKYKTSFLYRNRLISGLSDIVVVIEAAEKSGSLNTASHALEQGKTVFAVPGNITNPYSQGCNKLIKQGALPYTSPDDVLRELFPEDYTKKHQKLREQQLFGDTDVETIILQAIARGCRSGEEIMAKTHLPPEVFNQTVTLLEIKSRLRPLGMNNWGLI